MNLEQFEQLAGSIESLATVVALLIGGFWTYRKFIRQREDFPHIDFSVDLRFVAVQGDTWVVEVIAWLENKGKVQHRISDFYFELAYLKNSDELIDAQEYGGQLLFPNNAIKASWLPAEWSYTFIEPGIRTHYSYITTIPCDAGIALLHGFFKYENGIEFHSAETCAAIPSKNTVAA